MGPAAGGPCHTLLLPELQADTVECTMLDTFA